MTKFKKGKSGNPGGLTKERRAYNFNLGEKIREAYPPEVIVEEVQNLLGMKKCPALVKAKLIKEIMDRGYGRAPQVVELEAKMSQIDYSALTEGELLEVVRLAMKEPKALSAKQVIDVEAEEQKE